MQHNLDKRIYTVGQLKAELGQYPDDMLIEYLEEDAMKECRDVRPGYYRDGRKYEPKDVIRDWGLNFNLGNAVKYISRAGYKEDKIEDLRKARTYLDFELDALIQEENGGED